MTSNQMGYLAELDKAAMTKNPKLGAVERLDVLWQIERDYSEIVDNKNKTMAQTQVFGT